MTWQLRITDVGVDIAWVCEFVLIKGIKQAWAIFFEKWVALTWLIIRPTALLYEGHFFLRHLNYFY